MTQLQMSMSDVAALSRVRRPVPSTWRRRSATSDTPFPPAVDSVAGEERFDAGAVVDWLEATGRGKNPEARDDVAAFALPRGVDPRHDQRLFDALSALLCLRVVVGHDLAGLDAQELVASARTADPGDEYLLREIVAVAGEAVVLAELADARADAAYSTVAAFDQLQEQRLRYGITAGVRSSLAPAAYLLVSRLAAALAVECGAARGAVVDPIGTGSELVMSSVLAAPDADRGLRCPTPDTVQARAFRRRLRTHDIHRADLPESLDDHEARVMIVHPAIDAEPGDALDAIDDVVLTMTDLQRAIVVGPASLLVDRLRDRSLDGRRAQILRVGRTRAMLRLPAGLVTHRSRQALAVWVLGTDHSRVDLEHRRIAVADVSDEPLTDALVDELVDDAVATVAAPRLTNAHAFARAGLVPTSAVLAARGALVRTPPSAPQTDDAAGLALEIETLRGERHLPDALGDMKVTVGAGQATRLTTVGDAITQGALRFVAGHRDGFDLVDDGNVAVIGPAELVGDAAAGDRRVDRVAFLTGWNPNRLTEAGDVVFCTSPRPAALVDVDGGSAAQYPARILRIDPLAGEGLSAHVVARTINAQPARSRRWRSWPLRLVPAAQVAQVDDAMTSLAALRADAAAHLDRLDQLSSTLLDALTSGALVLEPTPEKKDH